MPEPCSVCRSLINDGDSSYCHGCYESLKDVIESREQQIIELEAKIIELERTLEDSKSETETRFEDV